MSALGSGLHKLWSFFWRPSTRWGLGPLLILGALAGIVFWGGFNTALDRTNTLDFCISCHEMRDTVYQEYLQSPHYKNASGVRAACPDCHVPHDWTHKMLRKIQASTEVWGHLTGVIDTPEKFAAMRPALAREVWAVMKATDSRECRNCHSFQAMDHAKQSQRAREQMETAEDRGKTCIDCHKGIAHKLPPKDD
jgi:nitrate/TMAO reductase-like tetraheme cytochrome c subunit